MKKWSLLILVALCGLMSCKIVSPKLSGARAFALTEDPNGNKAIRLEIRIDNPNPIGFKVNDPVFEVFLNSKNWVRPTAAKKYG